ncbi:imidazoleglycerol-phosphate dehydratase HisB [Gammaproteobacteria bacterium]|nr:imidazoleglycerol-phosphate dehydratase HisB [Gammaproteobacteria bacterium]
MTSTARRARVERNTRETAIVATLDLDGTGSAEISTGVGFLDHMLDQWARHGNVDLAIACTGDLHIDAHHSVEDCGIVLGQALRQALGDAAGVRRFSDATIPLDEALTRVVVDLSGRPGLHFRGEFSRERVGEFDSELVSEFFQGFVNHAQITLHIDLLAGSNCHHMIESCFKAFARALGDAVAIDPRTAGRVPSTKGSL